MIELILLGCLFLLVMLLWFVQSLNRIKRRIDELADKSKRLGTDQIKPVESPDDILRHVIGDLKKSEPKRCLHAGANATGRKQRSGQCIRCGSLAGYAGTFPGESVVVYFCREHAPLPLIPIGVEQTGIKNLGDHKK